MRLVITFGARLFKFKVDEFGIGIPPQAWRYWRRKGSFKIGGYDVKVPAGRRMLGDFVDANWVDAVIKKLEDGSYVLVNLECA